MSLYNVNAQLAFLLCGLFGLQKSCWTGVSFGQLFILSATTVFIFYLCLFYICSATTISFTSLHALFKKLKLFSERQRVREGDEKIHQRREEKNCTHLLYNIYVYYVCYMAFK